MGTPSASYLLMKNTISDYNLASSLSGDASKYSPGPSEALKTGSISETIF